MPAPVTYPDTYISGETGVFQNIDIQGLATGRHTAATIALKYSAYGTAVQTIAAEATAVATKKVAHQS